MKQEVETNLLSENTQRQSVRYKSIFCQLRRRIARLAQSNDQSTSYKNKLAVAVFFFLYARWPLERKYLSISNIYASSIVDQVAPAKKQKKKKQKRNSQ